MDTVARHFVVFYSPGTMVSETTAVPIDAWNVGTACALAHKVVQRYNATPYAFRFETRSRGPEDLDSKVTLRSDRYFLGGATETLEEIEKRNLPEERTLLLNMKTNGWDRVITNTNSWRHTSVLMPNDVVLDWKPEAKKEKV